MVPERRSEIRVAFYFRQSSNELGQDAIRHLPTFSRARSSKESFRDYDFGFNKFIAIVKLNCYQV